ncbi:hypothetical protein HanIR_Chr02g0081481 [Helianthus annuus]|nr:hypothetical protein HanIR_Chr02g0081481 [Helianthus annuus]
MYNPRLDQDRKVSLLENEDVLQLRASTKAKACDMSGKWTPGTQFLNLVSIGM